ncbi:PREDICTED: uncharacterized protein LOC104605327 [Nelumbo nucifera]|uniref:Uncharacterized protein LOC104605327 n=1 Tax=Nelumbo nucifera TaxID=4432 RepID=A0A1U8Q960_NELNU|nr:PREDICTED: uncharacterized protein LOC104605327 [Nelumbo nucifera]
MMELSVLNQFIISTHMGLFSYPHKTYQLTAAPVSYFRTGSPFQRLVSFPNPSREQPNRSSARWGIKTTVACFGEKMADGYSPTKELRRILESPGIHQGPACFDALSAKLVERAGFEFCFTSGFSVSAARLGLPDVGLISYGEMVDQGHQITQAVSIPVIGDGDNGYGNAMNVKRTVKGFIKAGFSGIILEDQVHILCLPVVRFIWIMGLFSSFGLHYSANMLEGGGKTPILNPVELEEMGFKIVSYPLSLIGVSIRAMQDALIAIKGGRIPPPGNLPSFEEIKEILGFNAYSEEEEHYVTNINNLSLQRGSLLSSSNTCNIQQSTPDVIGESGQSRQDPVIEVITPDVYNNYGADGPRGPFSGIWSRTLRVKITGRDGFEKLDIRIPAGFLDGITNIVPALGGVNIKALLDDAVGETGGKLLDFNDSVGDRIQVFLE